MGSYSCLVTVSELGTTVMAGTLMHDYFFRIPRRKLGETARFFSKNLSILSLELNVARDLG